MSLSSCLAACCRRLAAARSCGCSAYARFAHGLLPSSDAACAAYGIVCAAIDSRTNEQVAIKKIGDIFANPLDARRTLREIQVNRWLCLVGVLFIRLRDLLVSFWAAQLRGACCKVSLPQPLCLCPPVQILRHVRGHSNIITLRDLFPPSCGVHDFRCLCGAGIGVYLGLVGRGQIVLVGGRRCALHAKSICHKRGGFQSQFAPHAH